MSQRLQVLLDEAQARRIRAIARRRGLSVAEWVRRAISEAAREEPGGSADRKLASLRAAVRHEFPAPDIDEMLAEIERGYGQERSS